METALLQQKVEFLEMEIEEVRRREENLKTVNKSLMQAIGHEPQIFKDQTLNELQKTNDALSTEISSLKQTHKQEISSLEKQIQELFLSKKELQIDFKHFKTSSESQKSEILSQINQLESEKARLHNSIKNLDQPNENPQKENQRLSLDNKNLNLNLNDSRQVVKEIDQFKSKLEYLSSKLRSKKEKIKRLKEKANEKALRVRMQEMEEELETYKLISKNTANPRSEIEKSLKKELEEAQITILSLRSQADPKPLIQKKDNEIINLKEKVIKSLAEHEKLNNDLNRLALKLQQNEIYWKMADQKRSETELALKNEIKFLIGKLLKAKSKLPNDDSKENTAKPTLVTTVRSLSVSKDLKLGKRILPLDLSSITRTDSPFCVSNLDI